jgi:glycosyltransferase involved in cell wall biosynthesis
MAILFSIVAPLYNESENIDMLYERIDIVMKKMSAEYELLFINDGSKDDTLLKILQLSSKHEHVKFIDFSRNFGHQIAVSAGLDYAKGQHIIIIDADLQDPPELIIPMYDKIQNGYDVVYAKRLNRHGESWLKKYTAKIFYRILSNITSVEIPIDTGDFRIMTSKVNEIIKKMPEQNKYLRGQVAWAGFSQTYVEYDRQARNAGETGYSYSKMIKFAMDGITAFSDIPLRLVTFFGFFVSIIALMLMLYALYSKWIKHDTVQGWSSLMVSILFLGGIQLISIGIIGEYISRINTNTRNRPLYIINNTNIHTKD